MQPVSKAALATAGALLMLASANARAITIDGTLDSGYGSALSTQTINTGFGDSTSGDGNSTGGSEVDAAYGVYSGGNLDLFFSGNIESTGNHLIVYLADGRSGQNVLEAPAGSTLAASNGSIFSPGFNATLAVDVNDYQGTLYSDVYTLTGTAASTYDGSVPLSGGVGSGTLLSGITYGFNNTNAAGVNGNTGTAASASAADAVTTGLELSIPLALLGNPTGAVEALADVNGSSDGYQSNQFLPGLPVGTGNLGGGGTYNDITPSSTSTFDFSSLPSEFVTVNAVPEPMSCLGIATGLGGLALRRRRSV